MFENTRLPLLVLVLAGGFWGWTNRKQFIPLPPIYQKPYMILYGRDACGFCRAMREGLDARKIPYVYKRIDEPAVREELAPRMEYAGLGPGTLLPIMDIDAEMLGHPSLEEVVARHEKRAVLSGAGR